MTITEPECAMLRALAWHRVMLVQRGGMRAKAALMLKGRHYLSTSRHDENRATIRITDAGAMAAAAIEKELSDVDTQ